MDIEDQESQESSASPAPSDTTTHTSDDDDDNDDTSSSVESHVSHKVLVRSLPCRFGVTIYSAPDDDDGGGREGRGKHVSHDVTGMYQVDWNGIIINTPVRKLISQSHSFFVELQELAKKSIEPEMVVKFSRLYRSILHECVQGLHKENTDDDDDEIVREQCELYSLSEIIWHLCEILYIETLPPGCLIQQLLEWVRWHNRDIDETLREVIMFGSPDTHQDYWKTIYCLVLQGRVEDVQKLLSHFTYCKTNKQAYDSMCELLRKMPMIKSVVGCTRSELRARWLHWKQECKQRRDRMDFIECHELNLLCGLLCGDEKCFDHPQVIDSCKMWYEMMAGRLLYCSPLVVSTDYDLHILADRCLGQYCELGGTIPSVLDSILLTALKNNIIDVIKQASGEISNWWLVAHMTNLLHHRGVLVMYQLEYGHKLSEYLILEYGSSLFVNPSLWQVAIDYFSYCPTKGRHYMSLFIERVQLTTINKCLKVVQICHKYGLKEQAQSICRILARRAFDEGQLSTALTWCLKSGDTSFAAFLAEKYFDKYEDIGEFCDLNVLDHLGGAMLLSNKLAFLGKYRECQKKYRRGEFKEAGLLMTDLILSNIVPEKYQLTMMVDLLPLLELKDMLVFDKMQTLSLMSHLHDLQYQQQPQFNQLKDDMEVTDDNITSSSNKITLLHSALTRNLSQAFISRRSTKIH